MTILVTGARGTVGRGVLRGLLAAGVPAGDLRGAGRDPSVLDLPAGVEPVGLDLDDPAAGVLDGVDRVFLYAAERPDAVADAARDAGVRHVVVLSSASVDEDPGPLGAHHREVEDAVRARGLTTTALRPGAFASNALGWAAEIREAGTVSTPYPDSHITPIHELDIADVAVTALTRAPVDDAVTLSGPESMSFRDQVGVLGRELGRALDVVALTPEQGRARMGRAPAAVVDSLFTLWAAADGVPQPVHDVARITGRPGRTFGQWVRDHRAAFTDG